MPNPFNMNFKNSSRFCVLVGLDWRLAATQHTWKYIGHVSVFQPQTTTQVREPRQLWTPSVLCEFRMQLAVFGAFQLQPFFKVTALIQRAIGSSCSNQRAYIVFAVCPPPIQPSEHIESAAQAVSERGLSSYCLTFTHPPFLFLRHNLETKCKKSFTTGSVWW